MVASAGIIFTAAPGAHLKALLPSQGLLTATSRSEATTWTATVFEPHSAASPSARSDR
ncbi:hypothetical protein J2Z21_005098 [Streptomyces griseochromogenes]|uniref:Uncharacterized protein n=1 Tax=Streptomyces griseochromogenes TaxID=68214 RepID=A0ABS4LXJ0_9ACTN|nr:hypothetical protein [Streptomyces griseochromogenes]MBP2052116.1 hypothetical protein [Streptomyces griseochromogenes]